MMQYMCEEKKFFEETDPDLKERIQRILPFFKKDEKLIHMRAKTEEFKSNILSLVEQLTSSPNFANQEEMKKLISEVNKIFNK